MTNSFVNQSKAEQDRAYTARLTPYRSLSASGFTALMIFMGVYNIGLGIVFTLHGAWPVFGFLGLEFALVYGAFRWTYWSARAYEEIVLRSDLLFVRHVSPRGRVREYHLNPLWTRLRIERMADEDVHRIALTSQGATVEIGAFLNPCDKTAFARAFAAALNRAKGRI